MAQVAFPPRNETLDFLETLNAYYRDTLWRAQAPGLHIDPEGIAVWLQEYLRLRCNGQSDETARINTILAIEHAVHPPDPR